MKIAIFLEKWRGMMKLTNFFQKIARRTERDEIDEITIQIIKIVRKHEGHGVIELSGKIDKFVLSQNEPAKIKNICKKIEDIFPYEKGGKELFLFSTDARLEKDLNEDTISKELKKRFKGKKISLSKNISINKNKEKDDEWVIINKDEFFSARKEGGKLNFYKELDKRIDFDSFEKKLYATIIRGYFRAAYLFIKDYRKEKSAKNCMEESLNSRLLEKIGYPEITGKVVFTDILDRSEFKTGPLLEEDIKAGFYYESLQKKTEGHLRHLLDATGCYGISGERGMGKSTLINKFVNMVKGKYPESVIIKISMPTMYKDEEFLTALLSKLCSETKKLIKESHPHIIGLLNFPSIAYNYFIPILVILAIIALIASFLSGLYFDDFKIVYSLSILLVLAIPSALRLFRPFYPNKRIKTYYEIEDIDNDIEYKKTLQIKEGANSPLLSIARTSTFKANPVMYSSPLLSEKLKDTIELVVKNTKTFSKVIFLIDDLDKQEKEDDIRKILKNLRFLSSVRDCLTIVSVRAGLANEFKDKDSEVRTLFDDILDLDKLDEDKLRELIERRVISIELGGIFLEKILSKHLFSIDAAGLEESLNKGVISEELKKIFKTKGFPLSENANIRKEKEDKWKVTNEEKIYIVKKEDGKLNIYLYLREFWDTLIEYSEKVPREAIRLFHRSFREWLNIPDTLDEALAKNKPKPLIGIVSVTESPKRIIIKHKKGGDIDLKEVNMIIEVNKKKTTVFPVADVNKRDIFRVGDEMVIDMEKIIGERDDAIKVAGESTGVKRDNISGGFLDWKAGNDVKVTLADDQKGEILLVKERKITDKAKPIQ